MNDVNIMRGPFLVQNMMIAFFRIYIAKTLLR